MVRAPCCENVGLKKGRWSSVEDDILTKYIQANGEGSWRSVPKIAGLQRCGKSCRLRWINYLRPDLKRGNFSDEEEDLIIRLHASMGNRWSSIARQLHGRTDNEIKNYWNSHLSRKYLTDFNPSSGKAEVISEWKLRKGRSRQRTRSKKASVSAPMKDMKHELDSIVVENGMHASDCEESFQITEYIHEEGKDHSGKLFSIHCPQNDQTEETEADISTHNSNISCENPKTGIKLSKEEVNTKAASDEDYADWDWKSLVNVQKLLEEDDMLSMLLDDSSSDFS